MIQAQIFSFMLKNLIDDSILYYLSSFSGNFIIHMHMYIYTYAYIHTFYNSEGIHDKKVSLGVTVRLLHCDLEAAGSSHVKT